MQITWKTDMTSNVHTTKRKINTYIVHRLGVHMHKIIVHTYEMPNTDCMRMPKISQCRQHWAAGIRRHWKCKIQKGQNPKEIQTRKFLSVAHFFYYPKLLPVFFCVELKWPSPQLLLLLFSFSISLRNSSSSYFGTMKLLCGSKLVSFTTYRLPQTAIPAMPRGFYCCHSYLRSPLKKTPDLNQMTRCWPLDWYYYQYLVPFFKAHKRTVLLI